MTTASDGNAILGSMLTASPPAADPYEMLRDFLADDRAAGIPFDGRQFAHKVWLVARETRAGRAWVWTVVETAPAWRSAYLSRNGGALAHLDASLLDDDASDYAASA